MKTLATIFALVVLTIGSSTEKSNVTTSEKVIAHETLATPAEFGFGNSFNLDIDKDGMNDFMFTTLYINEDDGIHTKYLANSLGDNQLLSAGNDAAMADAGNPLESFGNIEWNTNPVNILEEVNNGSETSWRGLWSGDRDQYIGIRLVKDNTTYTGWVKVRIDQENEKAQVVEYAINRVPESMIQAGEV